MTNYVVKDYKIISQDYPTITIEDFNQHLKTDFVDLKIFQDTGYVAGLYSLIQVYGETFIGYTNGLRISIELSTTNTGDITINVSNAGVKKVFANDGVSQVPASFIVANKRYYIEYDTSLDASAGAYKLVAKNDDEKISESALDFIKASFDYVENFTKRTLYRTTFEVEYLCECDCSCCIDIIELRKIPFIQLKSITIDDDDYSLDNVVVNNTNYPYIYVNFDSKQFNDKVIINFDAGYMSSIALPSGLKNSILELVAFLYTNRGDCNSSQLPSYLCKLFNGYVIYNL